VIVLDTHVWVWWVSDPHAISAKGRRAIDGAIAGSGIFVSSISAWEVALLVARRRLELTMDVGEWIQRSEALPFFNFIPIDNAIAVRSVHLAGPLHDDPADRIIVATALTLGAPIVTRDKRLLKYTHARTIW
jgi:PIN domain nuclease of toxin-antitoxin system